MCNETGNTNNSLIKAIEFLFYTYINTTYQSSGLTRFASVRRLIMRSSAHRPAYRRLIRYSYNTPDSFFSFASIES